MKKLKKLSLIEAPELELSSELMEDILAGWACGSYAPSDNTPTCLTKGCSGKLFEDGEDACKRGSEKNFCYCFVS